ncbi:transcriptional regulator [Pasteurellaceae bacterium 15-036681]|nr:transcriptional regulator [Pasteurellaceae bacterium 15-036681]
MAKKFSALRAKMPLEAQLQAQKKADEMIEEMLLQELRQARGLSQKEMAERLNVQQPAIARLEKRTDMYISTLRNHIEAMGGQLEVIARFSDSSVKIKNIAEL